jgi:hypothetical protein
MANSNLKPLLPNSHGTDRWFFRGEPMTVEQAAKYDPDDFMPDGRLKLAKFRKGWKTHKSYLKPTVTDDELLKKQTERFNRYEQLPGPKPDYFEWASQASRREQFDELERAYKSAERVSDKLKALNTLLEFSKSRPKTTLEVSQSSDGIPELTNEELLRMALEMNGINYDKFKEIFQTDIEATTLLGQPHN